MGKVVKKNNLSAYLNNLKRVQKDAPKYFAEKIAEEGKTIAESYYNSDKDQSHQSSIMVSTQILENGKARVVASGEGLVYLEYGIGRLGKQSNYKFNKKSPVRRTFYSNKLGRMVSLDEWKYSYANDLSNGQIPEIQGHKAYKQMFNTGQDLRQKYAKYVRENPDV